MVHANKVMSNLDKLSLVCLGNNCVCRRSVSSVATVIVSIIVGVGFCVGTVRC